MERHEHHDPHARNVTPWTRPRQAVIADTGHDSYRDREHFPEPTVCTGCHAVFEEGRWTWAKPSKAADERVCPACRRIADDYPAGFLTLSGSFLDEHRTDILNLIENEANAESREHPLHRIMDMEDDEAGGLLVRTTDVHLPRRIGEALHGAFHGELDYEYLEDETVVRVTWQRERQTTKGGH